MSIVCSDFSSTANELVSKSCFASLSFFLYDFAQRPHNIAIRMNSLLEELFLPLQIIQYIAFVLTFAENVGNVFDGEFHLPQPHDNTRFLDFAGVVETVSG